MSDSGHASDHFRHLSKNFDPCWYVDRYPDVSGSGISPLLHYSEFGALLGRLGAADENHTPYHLEQNDELPKITIICISYNQEKFVSEAIESFLMQKCDFAIEILLCDDASVDNTYDIILKYAAIDKRITPIRRVENLGPQNNFLEAARVANGKYIAVCEGDDYWLDPLKLQKQCKYLDEHPECSLCFHFVRVLNDMDGTVSVFPPNTDRPFNLVRLIKENFIQTNSVVYRWRYDRLPPHELSHAVMPTDWYFHLLHAEVGGIGFIPETMSVYRRHWAGIWSGSDTRSHRLRYVEEKARFFKSLKNHFGGFFNDALEVGAYQTFKQGFEDCCISCNQAALYKLVYVDLPFSSAFFRSYGLELGHDRESSPNALWLTLQTQITVSIVVLASDDQRMLRKFIEGALMQRGCFLLEIVLSGDININGLGDYMALWRKQCVLKTVTKQSAYDIETLSDILLVCSGQYIYLSDCYEHWLFSSKIQIQTLYMLSDSRVSICTGASLWCAEESHSCRVPELDESNRPVYGIAPLSRMQRGLYRRDALKKIDLTLRPKDLSFSAVAVEIGTERWRMAYLPHISSVEYLSKLDKAAQSDICRPTQLQLLDRISERLFYIDELKVLPRNIRAMLERFDSYVDRSNAGKIVVNLVGWIYEINGSHLELVTAYDGRRTVHPLSIRRPDVELMEFENSFYRSSRVGFDVFLEIDIRISSLSVEILQKGDDLIEWNVLSSAGKNKADSSELIRDL